MFYSRLSCSALGAIISCGFYKTFKWLGTEVGRFHFSQETFFSQETHDAILTFLESQRLGFEFFRHGQGFMLPHSHKDWTLVLYGTSILFAILFIATVIGEVFAYFWNSKERQRQKKFHSLHSIKDVKERLDPKEFEYFTAYLFQRLGFYAERVGFGDDEEPKKKSKKDGIYGDGGKDVILKRGLFRCKTIVQCKFYTDAVGVSVVRELVGTMVHYGVKRGVVITPSSFSKDAVIFAKGKNIELIDGKKINKLLKEFRKKKSFGAKLVEWVKSF